MSSKFRRNFDFQIDWQVALTAHPDTILNSRSQRLGTSLIKNSNIGRADLRDFHIAISSQD